MQRLAPLGSGAGAYANDGPAARALLAKRGTDDASVTDAKKATLQQQGPTLPVADTAADVAALEANENAVWNWYLEWSQGPRTAMSNHAMLKLMGLTGSKRRVEKKKKKKKKAPRRCRLRRSCGPRRPARNYGARAAGAPAGASPPSRSASTEAHAGTESKGSSVRWP